MKERWRVGEREKEGKGETLEREVKERWRVGERERERRQR